MLGFLHLRVAFTTFVCSKRMPIIQNDMKKTILLIIAIIGIIVPAKAQHRLFPYPAIPDSLTNLYDRTDFLVAHFWEQCDMKKALKSPERLDSAFRDYISFMPHATVDVVYSSIDNLFTSIKNDVNAILSVGQMAEDALYGEKAEYWSDELYLKFIEPIILNKKVPATDRARYEHQYNILSKSIEGMTAPNAEYTTRYGATHNTDGQRAEFVVLFFNDPECEDCSMIKLRLDADVKTTSLIESGRLKVVAISITEPSDEWKEMVKDYPFEWEVGASPDIDSIYDIRSTPSIYLLNKEHKIVAKNLNIDVLLRAISVL